jgi:hypothetical protein
VYTLIRAGVIAVVILIGGFTWMIAGDEKVGEAKMVYAGVMASRLSSSYAIASFVIKMLVSATTEPGPSVI